MILEVIEILLLQDVYAFYYNLYNVHIYVLQGKIAIFNKFILVKIGFIIVENYSISIISFYMFYLCNIYYSFETRVIPKL